MRVTDIQCNIQSWLFCTAQMCFIRPTLAEKHCVTTCLDCHGNNIALRPVYIAAYATLRHTDRTTSEKVLVAPHDAGIDGQEIPKL